MKLVLRLTVWVACRRKFEMTLTSTTLSDPEQGMENGTTNSTDDRYNNRE